MSLRRRNGFDGPDAPREDLNLTKYQEKYVFPTDGMQSSEPAPTPAPAPERRSEPIFGGDGHGDFDERRYVFGERREQSAPVTSTVQPMYVSERPMVFVLRNDDNMYVYEYSDRLEFYRRTDRGMEYCTTKFKAVKH